MNIKKVMYVYGVIAGIAYLIAGLLELTGLWYHDIFGGIALLIISSVYLASTKHAGKEMEKSLAFVTVGAILSSIFGVLYILILFADWLEYLIGNASFSTSLRAEIILFIAVVPLLYMIKREIVERDSQIFQ